MRHFYLALFSILSFVSFSQEVDRSNYQLLWEISGNNLEHPSYLFGTFHSNDNEIFDFPDSLYVVLNQAEAIVLETDITDMMDDADVLKDHSLVYDSTGLDWIMPDRKSNEITYTSYGSDEGRPQFIDLYFKQVADNCEKDFYPLESLADQMKIGLNPELKEIIVDIDDKPSKERMKQLYLEGNVKKLHDITKQSTINFVNLYEELITNRNKVMLNGIDTLIQNQKVFCAVGAAHLLGDEGIVPLLRQKGYIVRPVTSNFSEEQSNDEKELAACRGYIYEDLRFGFSIQFSGKPKVNEEEQGSRFIQYQEMGQGNTYSIRTTHYETIDDLGRVAADFFKNDQLEVVDYKTIDKPNGVIVHQGKIIEQNGQVYWMRSFHRNDILYLVFCTGGNRFVNSERPEKYFNSFEFKTVHDDVVNLDSIVFSPTNTLSIQLPKGFLEHEEFNKSDKYWRAKWFNPNNGENFYAYENVLTDNSIYFTDDQFGEFLLSEFDNDSLFFFDKKSTNEYSEKSFRATKNGRKAYGKVRLIGNLLHFIQYTGNDSKRAKEFISSMDFTGFSPISDEVELQNKVFKTQVSKSGFKPIRSEERYGYRNTQHYFLNDADHVISYEVYVKTFKPWAFSRKGTRQLLSDQILWPDESIPVRIDTNFNLNAETPYLDFEITYTSSKNNWKGRSFLSGNKIFTYTQTQPLASVEPYESLTFLDSTVFETEGGDISILNKDLIIEELQSNGAKNLIQLAGKGHVDHAAALEILFLADSIFKNYDKYGELQAVLTSKLNSGYCTDSLTELWKRRSNNLNITFTEQFLVHLTKSKKSSPAFLESIEYANSQNINWNNLEALFVQVIESKAHFEEAISVFENRMKDSISWELTFLMEDAMRHEHFRKYFYSDVFGQIALNENQGDWVSFRYFELLFENSKDHSKLETVIKEWNPEDDFNLGVSVAWKEILGISVKRKIKKKVSANIFSSTAYAKVMAVTNQKIVELYSYEEVVGLIAFDHYEDNFFDENKTIEYLKRISVKEGGQKVEYGLFECIENNKVFYLTRKLNSEKQLPSYKDFGSDSHFFQYDHTLVESEIKADLEKRLREVYGI